MRWGAYVKDKVLLFLFQVVCAILLGIYLRGVGLGSGELTLLYVCWGIIVLVFYSVDFLRYRSVYREFDQIMESLDQKYLFAEIAEVPPDLKGKLYFSYLKKAFKSMIEHVTSTKVEQQEYQEFIEGWIHEIKVPITTVKLACANDRNETTRKILAASESIDREVEKALFYARLGNVEHDLLIRETDLEEVIQESISRNKQQFIQNRIQVELNQVNITVYTDGKWLVFILGQILSNSVKYRGERPLISITGSVQNENMLLKIRDNGVGIRESELPRIFQRGFTGTNGRAEKHATGLGLYLCKKLCDKLHIGIEAASEYGSYTEVTLIFADERFFEVAENQKADDK